MKRNVFLSVLAAAVMAGGIFGVYGQRMVCDETCKIEFQRPADAEQERGQSEERRAAEPEYASSRPWGAARSI